MCNSSLKADSSSSVIRPNTVVSSANLAMTLELCVSTQSCVYKEYGRGLRTQPCGALVMRVSEEEMLLPTLTIYLLSDKPGSSCRELFRPRARSFTTSLEGTMVLNAEL